MQRLFLGIPISYKLADDLIATVAKNAPKLAEHKVRWLHNEQIHVTVHFFGQVSADKLMTICQLLPERLIDAQAFSGQITAIANFPHSQSNIIAAYVQLSPPLAALYAAVQDFLQQSEFSVERRPYLPHITICRLDRHAKFTMSPITLTDVQFVASELILYESKPTAHGSEYITLVKFVFKE